MSQSLAKQAAQLNASMQLATKPFVDVENSGAMQMLKQAQEAANRVSVNFKMYDDKTLKLAGAMRNSMSVGIVPEKWQQLTGLETSIDAVTKFKTPLVDMPTLTGIGTITPPKSVLNDLNISALNQATITAQSFAEKAMAPHGLTKAIEEATKN